MCKAVHACVCVVWGLSFKPTVSVFFLLLVAKTKDIPGSKLLLTLTMHDVGTKRKTEL